MAVNESTLRQRIDRLASELQLYDHPLWQRFQKFVSEEKELAELSLDSDNAATERIAGQLVAYRKILRRPDVIRRSLEEAQDALARLQQQNTKRGDRD